MIGAELLTKKVSSSRMKTKETEKTAIFPGRFQPFHKGHYQVIEKLRDEYNLVVLIGSAQKQRTEDNPLSLAERKEILQSCLPQIETYSVKDVENDRQWVAEIEKTVDFDLVVTGNPWTKQCFEPTDYPTKQPQFHQPETYSGHNIRQRIRQDKKWQHLVPNCALRQLEQFKFTKLVTDRIEA